jgi:hypothetical protein
MDFPFTFSPKFFWRILQDFVRIGYLTINRRKPGGSKGLGRAWAAVLIYAGNALQKR